MEKGADAFRSIGEVAKLIGVAPHVLRYWETQFSLLSPMKRRDGRRYYRPDDLRLVAGLCEVLREEGLTIRGARKLLAADRGAAIRRRGAARLGEVLANDDGPAAQADRATAPQADKTPRPVRHRKRTADDSKAPGNLPLFPNLSPDAPTPGPRIWLHHLVATAATLRRPQSAIPHHAREKARRLHKALGALT